MLMLHHDIVQTDTKQQYYMKIMAALAEYGTMAICFVLCLTAHATETMTAHGLCGMCSEIQDSLTAICYIVKCYKIN